LLGSVATRLEAQSSATLPASGADTLER